MTHHKYAPSAAERWWYNHCPGSVELAEKQPSNSSIYAEDGTNAHRLAIHQIRGRLADKKELNDLEPDAKEAVRVVDRYLTQLLEKLTGTEPGPAVLTEFYMISNEIPDFGGTADIVIVDYPVLEVHVVDLKFGAGVVVPQAKDNLQLTCYMLLASEVFSSADTFHGHIWQPRRNHFSSHILDREQLDEIRRDILLAQAQQDLRTGSWCHFCPAKTVCPALHKKAVELADFDLIDPAEGTDQIERWKEVLQLMPAIKSMLEEIPRRMRAYMEKGESIPGWKLVHALGNRRWLYDETRMFKELRNRGVKRTAATVRSLMSPAQLEKAGYAKEIEGLYERPDKGLVVVPEDDRRAAVEPADVMQTFFPEEEDDILS